MMPLPWIMVFFPWVGALAGRGGKHHQKREARQSDTGNH